MRTNVNLDCITVGGNSMRNTGLRIVPAILNSGLAPC